MTGPGEMIDVIVTERGIAINPLRTDLLDAVKGSKLPVRPIQDIKAEVEKLCGGKPAWPKLGERPCAVVKWVDGTVLDTVWQGRGRDARRLACWLPVTASRRPSVRFPDRALRDWTAEGGCPYVFLEALVRGLEAK